MPLTYLALIILSVWAATNAQAQHSQLTPYAGFAERAVKALSAQQVADLKAGRGMGLALPAELNGYPGPLHALELADALALTPPQRARMQDLIDAMREETIPLGERLIAEEIELDRLFATRQVTRATLTAATDAIGATQAALRAAHLGYHLTTLDILTPDQVHRYGALRGYAAPQAGPGGHKH